MQAMLACCDANGSAPIKKIVAFYQRFYLKRIERKLPVDKETCIYTGTFLNDTVALQRNMLENPFEKYERKRFVYYGKDIGLIAFNPLLWQRLGEDDKAAIKDILQGNLEAYYAELGGV
jgi:CDP-glycerol glycerophosphotransferase (TagB/SpsB family)